jgi:hypothetical protein
MTNSDAIPILDSMPPTPGLEYDPCLWLRQCAVLLAINHTLKTEETNHPRILLKKTVYVKQIELETEQWHGSSSLPSRKRQVVGPATAHPDTFQMCSNYSPDEARPPVLYWAVIWCILDPEQIVDESL